MNKIFFKYDYSNFSLYNMYLQESFGAVVFKLSFTIDYLIIFLVKIKNFTIIKVCI